MFLAYLLPQPAQPADSIRRRENAELWTLWKQAQRLSPAGRERLAACIRRMLEAEAGERRRLAENLTADALWREIESALSPGQSDNFAPMGQAVGFFVFQASAPRMPDFPSIFSPVVNPQHLGLHLAPANEFPHLDQSSASFRVREAYHHTSGDTKQAAPAANGHHSAQS